MKKLVIFLSIVLSVNLFSQSEFWEKKFESKNRIESLAFDSEGNIYAGVEYKGIFKSKDSGNTWENINKGLTTSAGISCIVLNSNDDLFCGVTYRGHLIKGPDPLGVFRSTNHGETWHLAYETIWVKSIVIDPGNNIYACCETYNFVNDIVFSDDNGNKWDKIEDGLPEKYVKDLIMDENANLFMIQFDGGLYKSTNKGNSWNLVDNEFGEKGFTNIVSNFTGTLIARIGGKGLFKSTDEGESWEKIEYSGDLKDVHDFLVTDEGDIYLASNDIGLQYLKHGNSDWQVISPNQEYQISTVIRFDKDGYLWAVRMLGNKNMDPFPFYEPAGYELYKSKKRILNND